MPYITSAERMGIEKGIQEGIQEGIQQGIQEGLKEGEIKKAKDAVIEVLETRFGLVPMKLIKRIKGIDEAEVLSSLLKKAVTVKDLEEFEQMIDKVLG